MLKIKDRKYFPVRLLSRIYIFFDPGDGRDGGEVAQKHSVFLSTVGEPRGEGTTHSRSRAHLTNGGRNRKCGGNKYGAADGGRLGLTIYIKLCHVLAWCCLACLSGGTSALGRDWSCGRGKAGGSASSSLCVWLLFQLRNFFFRFLIFKKNHSQNKTLNAKSKMAALTLFIKTRESLPLVGGPSPSPQGPLHFPRDLSPLASDGVLHGFELFQELLAPRQRAGLP